MGWCYFGNNQRGIPFTDMNTYGPSQLAPPFTLWFINVPNGKVFGSPQGVLLTDNRGSPDWVFEGPVYGCIIGATPIGHYEVHAEALREFHTHMELISR